MTIAFWCVLIAGFMPYVWVSIAKMGAGVRNYDNNAPREYLEKMEGWMKRANWAQSNSFEAFPFFAAAVVIAHLSLGQSGTADNLAIGFTVCRFIYGFCYIFDQATLRSLIWTGGIACTVGLFIISA